MIASNLIIGAIARAVISTQMIAGMTQGMDIRTSQGIAGESDEGGEGAAQPLLRPRLGDSTDTGPPEG
jgi:hypothetical protein